MPKLASNKSCTGCLACVNRCPHQGLDIIFNSQGLAYVKTNDNCINCGACELACPIIHPVNKNRVNDMTCFGGWSKNDDLRIKAASGGAFSAIATDFLRKESESVVYGACLADNRVRHISIKKSEEIGLISNSKYIQSNTDGIYRSVLSDLKNGKNVLFSGTPCQIAGLYAFLGKRDTKNLFTIEVICHGVLGNKALDLHLELHHSKKIYSFRDKKGGQFVYNSELTTIEQNGEAVKMSRKNDVFFKIFSSGLLERRSCSNCQFSSINRVADITIGDFWGGPYKNEDYKKGVSLIISNNPKGRDLVMGSPSLYKQECSMLKAIPANPNLYAGFKFIQYHPLSQYPDTLKKILSTKLWIDIVTNKMPWKLLWGFFKVLQKIYYKLKLKETSKLFKAQ